MWYKKDTSSKSKRKSITKATLKPKKEKPIASKETVVSVSETLDPSSVKLPIRKNTKKESTQAKPKIILPVSQHVKIKVPEPQKNANSFQLKALKRSSQNTDVHDVGKFHAEMHLTTGKKRKFDVQTIAEESGDEKLTSYEQRGNLEEPQPGTSGTKKYKVSSLSEKKGKPKMVKSFKKDDKAMRKSILKLRQSVKQRGNVEEPQPGTSGIKKHEVPFLPEKKGKLNAKPSVKSFNKDKSTARKSILQLRQSLKPKALGQKPDWLKIKRLSTEVKKERKVKKLTNYEKVLKAKKLWEEVRTENCTADKKSRLIVSIYGLMNDYLTKSIYAHDTSRVIQWLIKLGTTEMRTSMCDTLQPLIFDMMQRKFSNYIVKEFLKCEDKHCVEVVITAMKGNVVKLMANMFAAPIVEFAYSHNATSEQKRVMELEFFNTTHVILTGEQLKDLKSVVNTSIENKTNIIEEIKNSILKLIEKGRAKSLILHVISLEFLESASFLEKEEVLMAYHPHILELVHTKPGTRISMQCCWYLSKKVKKAIIKSLKGHVVHVCNSEEGYWLLLALFDSVDDTVVLKKIIITEILDNVLEIVKHEKGRKVILYLVAHRDTTYFHPRDIELLKTADTCNAAKKTLTTRRSEILVPVMDSILKCISSDVSIWFHDPSIAMVLVAIVKQAEGSTYREALQGIATFICSDSMVCEAGNEVPLVEHGAYNLVFKKILKNDALRSDDKDTLAYYLANVVTKEMINKWIMSNRGCFLLVHILETKKQGAVTLLLNKIDTQLAKKVENAKTSGSRILSLLLLSGGKVTHSP